MTSGQSAGLVHAASGRSERSLLARWRRRKCPLPAPQFPPTGVVHCGERSSCARPGWRQANNSTLFKRWFLKYLFSICSEEWLSALNKQREGPAGRRALGGSFSLSPPLRDFISGLQSAGPCEQNKSLAIRGTRPVSEGAVLTLASAPLPPGPIRVPSLSPATPTPRAVLQKTVVSVLLAFRGLEQTFSGLALANRTCSLPPSVEGGLSSNDPGGGGCPTCPAAPAHHSWLSQSRPHPLPPPHTHSIG